MQRSKQYALMFLLGALLTGGVMGFTVARTLGATDPREADAGSYRLQVATALQLTPAQRPQLDSILDQRNLHLREAMAPVRPQLDSIKNRARDQIRQMLTAEQRVRFEAYLAEQDRAKATPPSSKDPR